MQFRTTPPNPPIPANPIISSSSSANFHLNPEMEAPTASNNEINQPIRETPKPKKRGRKPGQKRLQRQEEEDEGGSRSVPQSPQPSDRRMRSQLAPDWTTKDSMILVNEIAAVEGDCRKALSSYQKWQIVVYNCNSLELGRTVSQCRRHWNSLLAEYNQIKQWDSKKSPGAGESSSTEKEGQGKGLLYWSLGSEKRKEFRLPEKFNEDLFKAVDDYVRSQKDHSDTEPENDPNADADLLEVIAKLGHKRHKRRLVPPKTKVEESPQECVLMEIPGEEELQDVIVLEEPQKYLAEELPLEIQVERKVDTRIEQEIKLIIDLDGEPQENRAQETFRVEEPSEQCIIEEKAHRVNPEYVAQESSPEQKSKKKRGRQKKTSSIDEEQRVMVQKMEQKVELIQAIIKGDAPGMADLNEAADSKNAVADHAAFVRRQADMLIACLGDIVSTINQLPHVVQECD